MIVSDKQDLISSFTETFATFALVGILLTGKFFRKGKQHLVFSLKSRPCVAKRAALHLHITQISAIFVAS